MPEPAFAAGDPAWLPVRLVGLLPAFSWGPLDRSSLPSGSAQSCWRSGRSPNLPAVAHSRGCDHRLADRGPTFSAAVANPDAAGVSVAAQRSAGMDEVRADRIRTASTVDNTTQPFSRRMACALRMTAGRPPSSTVQLCRAAR